MRVKFRNKIYLCTKVTHNDNSSILTITNQNGVYSVLTNNSKEADDIFKDLLIKGYADVSNCKYTNCEY